MHYPQDHTETRRRSPRADEGGEPAIRPSPTASRSPLDPARNAASGRRGCPTEEGVSQRIRCPADSHPSGVGAGPLARACPVRLQGSLGRVKYSRAFPATGARGVRRAGRGSLPGADTSPTSVYANRPRSRRCCHLAGSCAPPPAPRGLSRNLSTEESPRYRDPLRITRRPAGLDCGAPGGEPSRPTGPADAAWLRFFGACAAALGAPPG